MSNILILPDFEEGHLFPTFKMAENLRAYGYEVTYVGIPDVVEIGSSQGFATYPIFADIYPLGYAKEVKRRRLTIKEEQQALPEAHYRAIIAGELDSCIRQLKPRLILSSVFMALETLLLHYKYQIPIIVYREIFSDSDLLAGSTTKRFSDYTCLGASVKMVNISPQTAGELLAFVQQQGIEFEHMTDLIAPLHRMPHFMLCPRAFEPKKVEYESEYYLGPCIRSTAATANTDISKYLPAPNGRAKTILFASMGSQVTVYPQKARRFFQLLLAGMRHESLADHHLILSIGHHLQIGDFAGDQDNVSIHNWVPQTLILQKASLAVIHGGLGSIKECIYHGVPMIVIPADRDQFENARRVEKNNLGWELKTNDPSPAQLVEMILAIKQDQLITSGIKNMQVIFRQEEVEQKEVKIIEAMIGGPHANRPEPRANYLSKNS